VETKGNMQQSLWTKGLVFVIIGLFTGATILPNICGNMIEIEDNEDANTGCKVMTSEPIGNVYGPTVTYAIMCDWVDDNGQHGSAKTRFLSSQQVYFYAEVENVDVGDSFAGEWWYNEMEFVFVNRSNPTNWSGSGYLSFSWKPPYAGIWQVKIYHGHYIGAGPKFTVINNPPNTPTITGEISGAKKTSYDYTIQTTDPEENKVEYYIDWDDGTHNITDFYKSGEEISISHKWDKKGNYSVKVLAIDECWESSDWATLTVTMSYSYNKPIPQFLELLFQRFPNAFPLQRQLLEY
jgi:hypothetical protein